VEPGLIEAMHAAESTHWWFRARRRILLSILNDELPEGARLLDVGCGTGYFLEAAQEYWDVYGLDFAEEAVAFCRGRGLTNVRQASVQALADLEGGSFDCVSFCDVIEHLDDDVGALGAAGRLLRPGGLCLVTVPAYQWLWSPRDDAHHHRRRYTRASLTRTILDAGLQSEFVTYFNSYLFPLAVVSRLIERVFKLTGSEQVHAPPGPINNLFERIFRHERHRLVGKPRRGFKAGLSVLAIATLK
jgi:SAM-dependent methyltransferase